MERQSEEKERICTLKNLIFEENGQSRFSDSKIPNTTFTIVRNGKSRRVWLLSQTWINDNIDTFWPSCFLARSSEQHGRVSKGVSVLLQKTCMESVRSKI